MTTRFKPSSKLTTDRKKLPNVWNPIDVSSSITEAGPIFFLSERAPQGRNFCLKEPRRAENYFVWKSPAGSKMKMNQFILSKKSPAGPKIYRYNVFLTSDTNWNNSGSCRENLYVGQNLYVQTPHINLYVGKIYTWKKTFSIYKFCSDFAHI